MINVFESIIHTSLSSHLPYKTTRVVGEGKIEREREREREREIHIYIGRLNTESTVVDKFFR